MTLLDWLISDKIRTNKTILEDLTKPDKDWTELNKT